MRDERVAVAALASAALACTGAGAAAQSGAAPGWKGTYRAAIDGGRTAGGSAILVTHSLTVVPGAARGGCLLASAGFQTDERIVCHASGDARALTVSFHRYEDGRTVNRYGVAVYEPGQTLFTLERGDDGRVLTRWDGFRPDLPAEAPNPGAYFEPAR